MVRLLHAYTTGRWNVATSIVKWVGLSTCHRADWTARGRGIVPYFADTLSFLSVSPFDTPSYWPTRGLQRDVVKPG
jgi:hypothetical protein